jgi:hypothetical protein
MTHDHVGLMEGVLDVANLALCVEGGIAHGGFQQVQFHRRIVALLAIPGESVVSLGNSAGRVKPFETAR